MDLPGVYFTWKFEMKIFKAIPIGIVPVILMSYGWYLGQLHQSGYDIAGILLFMTGLIGLVLAFILFLLTRKYAWHNKWFANLLIGLAGSGIVFMLVLGYARLHG
jgi:Na+/H+-translocating membrane pyrophosphatase